MSKINTMRAAFRLAGKRLERSAGRDFDGPANLV